MCVFVIAIRIAALVTGFLALVLTFKAKFVVERVLKKEPTEGMVLRVKYIALALAVIAFLAILVFVK